MQQYTFLCLTGMHITHMRLLSRARNKCFENLKKNIFFLLENESLEGMKNLKIHENLC